MPTFATGGREGRRKEDTSTSERSSSDGPTATVVKHTRGPKTNASVAIYAYYTRTSHSSISVSALPLDCPRVDIERGQPLITYKVSDELRNIYPRREALLWIVGLGKCS